MDDLIDVGSIEEIQQEIARRRADAVRRQQISDHRAPAGGPVRRRRRAPGFEEEEQQQDDSSDMQAAQAWDRDNPADDNAEEAIEDNGPEDGGAPDAPRFGRCLAPDMKELLEKLGPPDPPSKCFGCTHSLSNMTSITFESYKTMEGLFAAKLEFADEIELARILYRYFEHKVRKPANSPESRKRGEEMIPEWSAASIYCHFKLHIDDFGIQRHSGIISSPYVKLIV